MKLLLLVVSSAVVEEDAVMMVEELIVICYTDCTVDGVGSNDCNGVGSNDVMYRLSLAERSRGKLMISSLPLIINCARTNLTWILVCIAREVFCGFYYVPTFMFSLH